MSKDPVIKAHSSHSDITSESIVVESNLSEISAPINAAQTDAMPVSYTHLRAHET